MKNSVDSDVRILWEYMQVGHVAQSADCLMVLGSRDDRVASYAAELAKEYSYGIVVVTGGVAHGHDFLKTKWLETTEAEHFHSIMKQNGYEGSVFLEEKAQNTGENAKFSYRLMKGNGLTMPKSMLIVTKPYMERRALATFEAQWPDGLITINAVSLHAEFDSYINEDQEYDDVVNVMVGDFQRIVEYPKQGFQSRQPVPRKVLDAWRRLVDSGYTKRLINL